MKRFLSLALLLLLTPAAFATNINVAWAAVSTMTDSSPPLSAVSYNVYGNVAGGTSAVLATVTTNSYTVTNAPVGANCFQVTAVVGGKEGAKSPQGCATVAAPASTTPSAPATISVTLAGVVASCTQSAASFVSANAFDFKQYGNYVVNVDNWGGTPSLTLWANSADCWGSSNTATVDGGSPSSYSHVSRGWANNQTLMQTLSSKGTNDFTTQSGLGLAVGTITKAKAHWAFTAPTTPASTSSNTNYVRHLDLMDVYFHGTATPDYSQFPPTTDLMIDQALMDEALCCQPPATSSFYGAVATQDHATTVTLGGVKYVVYIDDSGEAGYHNGGHTIHLFETPTAFSDGSGVTWGVQSGRHDLAAIITYFSQPAPKDDAGKALVNAAGVAVTSPLLTSDLFLTSINAGFEVNTGSPFVNSAFCVALQAEADCP